jgi:hypothetical protein
MQTLNQHELGQHCTILGWIHIVGHIIVLIIGVFIFMLLTGIGVAVAAEDPVAPRVLTMVGTGVGLLMAALALPGLAAGYGLLTRKAWSRMLALIVGILGLVNFPLGTAIGLYSLWVLLQPGATEYFQSVPPAHPAI